MTRIVISPDLKKPAVSESSVGIAVRRPFNIQDTHDGLDFIMDQLVLKKDSLKRRLESKDPLQQPAALAFYRDLETIMKKYGNQ